MTGCEQLAGGGIDTVAWVAGSVALGVAIGRRTAAETLMKNTMRRANWFAVASTGALSAGVFAYMVGDLRHHCGSPSAEILFALEPAALAAIGMAVALVAVDRLIERRARRGRRDRRS
jgi:hypothetical protein